MKSPLLLLLIVVLSCSMLQTGSTPEEAAEDLISRYIEAYESKNKTLFDDVVMEPFIIYQCNRSVEFSHEQIFKMALDSNQTVPAHKITDVRENENKTMIWFNVLWTMNRTRSFEAEAVLDDGIWRLKSQKMDCYITKSDA